jgi:dTDP-4-amino-4,6-dideoxygalactose transaminase
VTEDDDITVSPFFHTLTVAADRIAVSKEAFARAIMAEGIPLNPDYKQVVSEWPWFRPHLGAASHTPNAVAFRNSSFNVLFHENYREQDVADIVNAILKVERVLGKQ